MGWANIEQVGRDESTLSKCWRSKF